MQASLFPEPPRLRSPLCVYEIHCGAMAELGPPEDRGACINCAITCLHCGRTGERSERTP